MTLEFTNREKLSLVAHTMDFCICLCEEGMAHAKRVKDRELYEQVIIELRCAMRNVESVRADIPE